MDQKEGVNEVIFEGYQHYLRNISVDNVIFGYENEELKVLLSFHLLKKWALTGGFIKKTETLDEAALRLARQSTGLDQIFMKQFQAFGGPDRHQNNFAKEMNRVLDPDAKKIPEDNWLNDFFITIGYYSLVDIKKVDLTNITEPECRWWKVNELPSLLVDHNNIVESALKRLREDLNNQPVARELMPSKFTLPELHALYETVMDKKLDRANFYKKMKVLGWLEKLVEQKKIGAHKSPYLHQFIAEY